MTAIDDRFTTDWHHWHELRERDLATPHGWLAITRLEWLTTAPQRFDGLPGTWHHDNVAAYVRLEPEDDLHGVDSHGDGLDGQSLARFELGATAAGHFLTFGDNQLEIAHRGESYMLRLHDPNAPAVRNFRGVPAFEPDEGWLLTGRFEPFEQPRSVTVGAVTDGLQHVYSTPGEVVFQYAGSEHRLLAFNGKKHGLSLLFTDETSGRSTYGANRSLAVDDPVDGVVTLDFNRAINLPCAFIDLATCPLPPAGNHLRFAVSAGEKTPFERSG